ncbi:hypothetical protein MNEG_5945 [Monoraphidium neglectum]|uniref:Uncharacterized protein n=1 Tax=Monoraphidium neglectum TaxID=145388 RepID=A0A0D2JSN9_9CHLO|nr:hypothetical protein MNEG_5945 [Monoraphidium neglectum]KIZ02013.1 hypothetical protein MNEG_5945 [Monoraphidium neglectum]|eukprot:XP_013901032.1 hypothetical protein MNEG_5945 [Monoraphidium neglectum]
MDNYVINEKGEKFKVGGPRCPGYDPSADSGSASAAKSKAAKKNEKRKAKKADGHDEDAADASAAPSTSTSSAAPAANGSAAAGASAGGGQAAAAAGEAGAAALSGPAAVVDKQIKALNKKVRQCQSLATREKQGGEPLTSQEREKLDKMPGWEKEIRDLQRMMQQLTAGQ